VCKSASRVGKLVVAALVMLVTAWVAEESPTGGSQWWTWYLVSCFAWFYIVFVLFTQATAAMASSPPSIQESLKTLRLFVLVGWTIYPVGFLMALAGEQGESWREILYNIADVINKVFFGLVCYQGVKGLQDSKSHAAHA